MEKVVLTLVGDDRPGIVEVVAGQVTAHGGNWLESRMARLANKFAGVLCVELPKDRLPKFQGALTVTERENNLHIHVELGGLKGQTEMALSLELLGPDRPGLVRDVAGMLASKGVNVVDLTTHRVAAPMSGEGLFRANVRIAVSRALDTPTLKVELTALANGLGMELDCDF